jgi:phospholipid/cholesterol/gamma-HCH transport system ATP-binding protein
MIEARDLYVSFGSNHVLKGLSVRMEDTQTFVIAGRSGIGKTVLLRCLAGLLKPDKGRIYIDGEEITETTKDNLLRIRKKIGMLLQQGALFDSMTVYENVAFPLLYHKMFTKKEIDKKVDKYLKVVEMDEYRELFPKELSGGMKRKVALARAMILEPKYLFYDEPTSGLDPSSAGIVESMIIKLKQEMRITSLIVTHDIELTRYVGDKIGLMVDGKITNIERGDEIAARKSVIYEHFIRMRERMHELNGTKI